MAEAKKKKHSPAGRKKAVKKVSGGVQLNSYGLTDKQEKFCQFYLIELNATKAARLSGYSVNTAGNIGFENLMKPEIQKRLETLRLDMAASHNVTKERIAQEYARLGFIDFKDLYREDGTMKSVPEMSQDEAAAIASIELTYEEYLDENLDIKFRYVPKKIKLADKKGALDSMVKLYGFAAPDKISPVNPDGSAFSFAPPILNITVKPAPKEDGE